MKDLNLKEFEDVFLKKLEKEDGVQEQMRKEI